MPWRRAPYNYVVELNGSKRAPGLPRGRLRARAEISVIAVARQRASAIIALGLDPHAGALGFEHALMRKKCAVPAKMRRESWPEARIVCVAPRCTNLKA